jgi:hypothetical protein
MMTTPPNRQQRATDHLARVAAGPRRAAQRAGSRRDRPNRARRALSGPVIALGSSAADLTSPSAKLARTVKPSPTGPGAAGRAAVALTGRAGVANHATNPALPSIHYPMTTPEPGCELHAQISEKDSDTRQLRVGWGVGRAMITVSTGIVRRRVGWMRSSTRRLRGGVCVAVRSRSSAASFSIRTSFPNLGRSAAGFGCTSGSVAVAGAATRGVTRFRPRMRWGRPGACSVRARSR